MDPGDYGIDWAMTTWTSNARNDTTIFWQPSSWLYEAFTPPTEPRKNWRWFHCFDVRPEWVPALPPGEDAAGGAHGAGA